MRSDLYGHGLIKLHEEIVGLEQHIELQPQWLRDIPESHIDDIADKAHRLRRQRNQRLMHFLGLLLLPILRIVLLHSNLIQSVDNIEPDLPCLLLLQ